MGLAKYQRKALEQHREFTQRILDRVWGLLPPTRERDAVRYHLHSALRGMDAMLKEPEQITMEEILDDENN